MEVALTKMSSKGQVVIPTEMREKDDEGKKFVVIKNGHNYLLKPASKMEENLKEDLEFARKTEEAWKRYETGAFVEMDYDDFLNEVETW